MARKGLNCYSLTEVRNQYIEEHGKKPGKEMFQALLYKFECTENHDVESFLHEKSIPMESQGESRTYLIFNDDGELIAYYAISIKPILLASEKKEGIEAKPIRNAARGKRIEIDGIEHQIVTTFLIGQIGRASRYESDDICLKEILSLVYDNINAVIEIIGGRIILIEVEYKTNEDGSLAESTEKLIEKYSSVGFTPIPRHDEETLSQLMKLSC